jgi:hypothetical protein
MKRILINILLIFISMSLIWLLSGCGPIISIEGVELYEVEKITKEVLPDEIDITFTPDGSLPIGSYILLGQYSVEDEDPVPILWRVIENKSHYRGNIVPPMDHVTLLTAYIIDLRGTDGEEPESDWEFRAKYGNNRYSYSNIRQWLNTSGKGGQWWESQHDTDAPPVDENFKSTREIGYFDNDGFLNSFNENELEIILETTLESGINNNADGGGTEMVTDKVFLLSLTEVGLSDLEGKNYFEGNPFVIFDSNESRYAWVSEQCYDNTNSLQLPRTREDTWDWWLRSPYSWGEYDVWMCDDEGTGQHRRAHIDALGIRPAINISYEGISFSGNGSMEDPYIIDW